MKQVSLRPDRNTHNGQQAQIHATSDENKQQMMDAVRIMLESVGEDPEREGLLKTPKRVAEAMQFPHSRLHSVFRKNCQRGNF